MPISIRIFLLCLAGLLSASQTACNMVPQQAMRQSQHRAYALYRQNRSIAAQNQSLQGDRQRLAQENSALQQRLQIADGRIDNLNAERSQLQQRYISMLNGGSNPLSSDATRRFQELAKKYPEFEFDPNTGVSKFNTDILFASGSAQIKGQAHPLLKDFAKIVNHKDAKQLNILVVGHTDDKPIARKGTKTRHATNWHLSTDRADSVVLALSKYGVREHRMGAAGYSKHQPLVANKGDKSRQRNRRVEIFVLAPDAAIASWDPKSSKH